MNFVFVGLSYVCSAAAASRRNNAAAAVGWCMYICGGGCGGRGVAGETAAVELPLQRRKMTNNPDSLFGQTEPGLGLKRRPTGNSETTGSLYYKLLLLLHRTGLAVDFGSPSSFASSPIFRYTRTYTISEDLDVYFLMTFDPPPNNNAADDDSVVKVSINTRATAAAVAVCR